MSTPPRGPPTVAEVAAYITECNTERQAAWTKANTARGPLCTHLDHDELGGTFYCFAKAGHERTDFPGRMPLTGARNARTKEPVCGQLADQHRDEDDCVAWWSCPTHGAGVPALYPDGRGPVCGEVGDRPRLYEAPVMHREVIRPA